MAGSPSVSRLKNPKSMSPQGLILWAMDICWFDFNFIQIKNYTQWIFSMPYKNRGTKREQLLIVSNGKKSYFSGWRFNESTQSLTCNKHSIKLSYYYSQFSVACLLSRLSASQLQPYGSHTEFHSSQPPRPSISLQGSLQGSLRGSLRGSLQGSAMKHVLNNVLKILNNFQSSWMIFGKCSWMPILTRLAPW